LEGYESQFQELLTAQLLARLGLAPRNADDDGELLRTAFTFLHERTVGYDRFYFDWYGGDASRAMSGSAAKGYAGPSFEAFRRRIADYAAVAPERLALPYYRQAGPCSLLIDEIETIWSAIDERDDWGPFEAKLAAIAALRSANPELVVRGRQP